jgi:hypothetical protein
MHVTGDIMYYSLTMAALFLSFLNRNFFNFFCKSSSTAHTLRLVACVVWYTNVGREKGEREQERRERKRGRERERVSSNKKAYK